MTSTDKPVTRRTVNELDGSFGSDRGRRIVATLSRGDVLILRPERSRRQEVIALSDVYRFAIKCRVNREGLEKARQKKEKKAAQRESRQIAYLERKLTRGVALS